ncbi:MAG: NAD-dependent epimerase/dehydratase family protein [Brumimicrobium sp.]
MIFVTGGTGLVGSHLLVELAAKHDEITSIYRNPSKIKTVEKLFNYYLGDKASHLFQRIKWIQCDVLDVPQLEEAMKGHKVVYHCAAIVSFKRRDFSKMIKINRYGTANVVNICLHLKVDKLCYVSSTAAVGNKDIPEDQLVDEEGKWILTDETSGYSIAKYSAEKEVWRGIEEGLNAVMVNPSIVLGAGDWEESSLVLINTINKGLKFYSPGSNAFVDARDVARIMVLLVEKDIKNERFLCIGENMSFKSLFDLIAKKLNKQPPKYKVSPFLMGIAWRVSVFWSVITFSTPAITKSSARSAFNHTKFSNKKLRETLDYTFYPMKETVKNAIEGRL